MPRRLTPRALPAALILVALVLCAGCDSAGSQAGPAYPVVSVSVGSRPSGQPLPPGFLGLSFEYSAVQAYTDPAVVRLVRRLSPGQRPVVRIGGNSTDETWWPQPGETRPSHAGYTLSAKWLAETRALAAVLDAKLIMGVNLAGGRPRAADDEARAFLRGIGARFIDAFEIGNEADLYGLFPWPGQRGPLRRPPRYSLSDYIREFSRWRAAIGEQLPVAGPAYATFDWALSPFIDAEAGLALVTFHHYPLDACLTNPSARGYPTIARLLSDQSSGGLAHELIPSVTAAHARHLAFRLDEINSASCGGKLGVSNSGASAVWMLDTLFHLAQVGVDGVNVHTFPGALYAPFSPTGRPNPEYYGMLMFTRAFPPGARLLQVSVSPAEPLKAWATTAGAIVLINKSASRAYQVNLHVPGWSGTVQLDRLRGGHSSGSPASITVPAASAVLVTQ